ncbi:MAG: histidine kinase dimerization/phospho-acceptor domain-containing protein [Anaerolineae bacterium]|nr:histidine kinase dimerization/phospho-acceptor domain-containing protein [Anaerolineae bacterium]
MQKKDTIDSKSSGWRRWSLRMQLIIMVTTIIIITVISLSVLITMRESQTIRRDLEERAKTTLESLDAAMLDLLYFSNVDSIETIAENFAETSGMLAVRVYDANGRILIATDDPLLEARIEPDAYGMQLVQLTDTQIVWTSDRLMAGKPLTVGRQILGAIHIELSTQTLTTQLQTNILQGFITAIIASALSIAAVFFVSRSLVAPIAELVKRTQSIAQGDLAHTIDVQGGSAEMTELANTIEYMRKSLQEIYAELEQRVVDRTVEMKQARDEALAAQRIANENSRLKSEFLSMMSHELRTPMNAIEGFTSIILNRMGGAEYNDKTERYINKVQSNSQRLLGLINDFLDLSRIESGRLELAHSPMSPFDMAQKWQDNLSVLAENKGLDFEVSVDPNLPETLYGDEESLSKIAVNLLGNAIKFTEEGTVSLSLEKQDNQMALEVRDTGMGIPPHARDFVFEEFRQVDQSSQACA